MLANPITLKNHFENENDELNVPEYLVKIIKFSTSSRQAIEYSKLIYDLFVKRELIKISDIVVNISPEGYDPSTIMLETMLLRKPIMNIILDEKIFDFEFQKQNAVISLRSSEDFKPIIKKILYDPIFQKQILKNEQIFINKYLMNFGNASSFLAQYIQNL